MIYTLSKTIITGISIVALIGGTILAKQNNTICTMEYAPVCASVQVKCIQAPCPPIDQTFSNKCQMNANSSATFLYEGECKEDGNNNTDLSNCESYFDGCNNCSVVDGEVSACTLMYCENPGEAKCTKYKDSLSMANPASVYCEKNGGNLLIENSEKGQYGICNFDDGSSCEERAYYRGECKQTPPIHKYISGYIAKNIDQFPDTDSQITFLQNLKIKFARVYKNIATSIQEFIEMLYSRDYELKKFTLDSDKKFISFSLHIPKSRKSHYTEKVVNNGDSSTMTFYYSPKKLTHSMIFNITMTSLSTRNEITKEGNFNTNKIIETDGYVFYYSQALDMPYDGEYADTYGNMTSQTQEIINSFKIIQQ